MTDVLGWRAKFGVLAPSTNTIVEPDFYRMNVPGVTAHFSRIHIRNQNLSDDAAFEALLGQVRQEIGYAVERVMTAEPDYMVMGMSSETFWGGVEGNRQFIQQIKALSGGLGVATGAEACERALHRLGAKRLGVVTPYQPVGDANVVRFFNEIGFDVVKIKGLRCPTAVSIAHVQEADPLPLADHQPMQTLRAGAEPLCQRQQPPVQIRRPTPGCAQQALGQTAAALYPKSPRTAIRH